MPKTIYDVVVVGAGVVGVFHAYFAAKRGLKVLLTERNPAPNDATVRNFGMVATATIAHQGEWQGYADATNLIYRQLREQYAPDDLTLRDKGTLYLVETAQEARLLEEFAAFKMDKGEAAHYLTAADALARYPFANPDYVAGALLLPNDMAVDPRQFIHRLLAKFTTERLFDYAPNTLIINIQSDPYGCRITSACGKTWAADTAIVCSGAEVQVLFPQTLRESGLRVCKLYMFRTVPQPSVHIPHNILSGLSLRRYPAFSVCPSYRDFIQTPFDEVYKNWGIHLLFKPADDGSVIIGDSHEYYDLQHPETVSFDLRADITNAIIGYGKRMIRLNDWTIAQSWYGLLLSHPTQDIFTAQPLPKVYIATGISGKGMTTAAGFAQHHIAQLFSSI